MKKAFWRNRIFFKSERIFSVDGIKTFDFRIIGSGKEKLLRVYEVYNPTDLGDQHFDKYDFIKYL